MSFSLNRVTRRTSGSIRTAAEVVPGLKGMIQSTGLGEFFGLSTKNVWRLKMLDPPGKSFRGQFLAENQTETVGSRISNNQSLGSDDVDRKYLGGSGDMFTFQTRVWAGHSFKNVKTAVENMKKFSKRDDKLKRQPIFMFTSGTEIQMRCFIQSVGGITYDRLRSDGTIRGATFQVTLAKIEDVPTPRQGLSLASLVKTGLGIITAGPSTFSQLHRIFIPGGSFHTKGRMIVTKQNQTFEHIATREYGDALSGDVLRRAYYQDPLNIPKLSLESGDVVALVDDDEIFDIRVTPQSVPLADNDAALENIKAHFELRGDDKVIFT